MLDNEHDARATVNALAVIAAGFGMWKALGITDPDTSAGMVTAAGFLAVMITRRLERKRRLVVGGVSGGGTSEP